MSLTISKLTAELDESHCKRVDQRKRLNQDAQRSPCYSGRTRERFEELVIWGWGAIATGRRLFIKRGVISGKVTEIPYANITSIEYMRRYSWKTLILDSVISLLLFIESFLRPIFSRAFISRVEQIIRFLLTDAFPQSSFLEAFLDSIPIIPFLIAVVVFAVQAKTGFALRGPGIGPLYLPRKFQEAIALTFERTKRRAFIDEVNGHI